MAAVFNSASYAIRDCYASDSFVDFSAKEVICLLTSVLTYFFPYLFIFLLSTSLRIGLFCFLLKMPRNLLYIFCVYFVS